jgi:hypothetical protein
MYLVKTPTSLPQIAVPVTAHSSALKMGPHNLHTYAGVVSQITTIHPRQQVQHPLLHNQQCNLEVKITPEDTVILVIDGSRTCLPQALILTQNLGLVMKLLALQQNHVKRLRPI